MATRGDTRFTRRAAMRWPRPPQQDEQPLSPSTLARSGGPDRTGDLVMLIQGRDRDLLRAIGDPDSLRALDDRFEDFVDTIVRLAERRQR